MRNVVSLQPDAAHLLPSEGLGLQRDPFAFLASDAKRGMMISL